MWKKGHISIRNQSLHILRWKKTPLHKHKFSSCLFLPPHLSTPFRTLANCGLKAFAHDPLQRQTLHTKGSKFTPTLLQICSNVLLHLPCYTHFRRLTLIQQLINHSATLTKLLLRKCAVARISINILYIEYKSFLYEL